MKAFKNNLSLTEQDIQKIKSFLSTKVLNNITDKSIQNIMRSILFNPDNCIDWDDALMTIYKNMPELTKG